MEIKPCKNCRGFLPLIKERPQSFLSCAEFTVTCSECGIVITIWADTREEALEAWNKENTR